MALAVNNSSLVTELMAQRIKRKPPPVLDVSERYPSPDPNDPFAPLWVLRNRTSSALHIASTSQENLQLQNRLRSMSGLQSPPHPNAAVRQPIKNLPTAPSNHIASEEGQRHYRRRSQSILMSQPPTPHTISQGHSPPIFLKPWPSRRESLNMECYGDGYSSGTESDSSKRPMEQKTTSFSPRTKVSQNKLARFLMPRRSIEIDSRPPATEHTRVRKSSISPPVFSTMLWESNEKRLIPVHSNPMYESAVPILANSVSLDAYYATDTKAAYASDPESTGFIKFGPKILYRPLPLSVSVPNGQATKKRRMSTAALSPIASSTHPTSPTSSYIHISTPSLAAPFAHSTAESAYTSPRPAPQPPSYSSCNLRNPSCDHLPHNKTLPHYSTSQPEWLMPTDLQLTHAASLPVIAESGVRVLFGSLFSSQRTVVIFIRHFWCPLCQDYMTSLNSLVRPETLLSVTDSDGKISQVHLVVISNGAHSMMGKYRQIVGLPFSMYTDPTLEVYSALGMKKDGAVREGNHHSQCLVNEAAAKGKDGGYVKHGLVGGIAMVVMRAIKVGMPVWEKGGDIAQLGGEFVFGPGLTCSYAHRMQTTKGHAPIQEVLQAAGVQIPSSSSTSTLRSDSSQTILRTSASLPSGKLISRRRRESIRILRSSSTWDGNLSTTGTVRGCSFDTMAREEQVWMDERQKNLEKLQEKKISRRGMIGREFNIEGFSRSESASTGSATQNHNVGASIPGERTVVRLIEDHSSLGAFSIPKTGYSPSRLTDSETFEDLALEARSAGTFSSTKENYSISTRSTEP